MAEPIVMTEFIELGRRFRDLRAAEFEQSDTEVTDILSSLGEFGLDASFGWTELLGHPRVVILAEAGSGKSAEMKEQERRMLVEGRIAFYVALESLDTEPMTNLFSQAEQQRFEAWKGGGQEPGWFFLDAVDELKLAKGKLDRALRRFAADVGGALGRAWVVISGRPSDWRSSVDLATVQDRLPVPEKGSLVEQGAPEDGLAEPFARQGAETVRFGDEEPRASDGSVVRTVKMLPMNDGQIADFAEGRGVSNAAAFLEEVERHNAWEFARRPLDLTDLVTNWTRLGRLGTRAEQHEANVTAKLKDDPDRADHDVLSDSQARCGAEWLALGLTLTRGLTILSPERVADAQPQQGVLEAETVLAAWTPGQRGTLLRRGLFDPATYGRIRFHHRSVQEYLAACCLRRLGEREMSTSALFQLLFAEMYGVEVVRPSMRAIAAWLALWDAAVLREMIKREPEALLSFGDPGTLELEARAQLLRAFVAEYGQGGWRRLEIGVEEVRRLSHPELGSVVRECWQAGSANPEVCEVLLELIRQGSMEACADLARSAAFNLSGEDNCRIAAVGALVACRQYEALRECVSTMLADDGSWPNEVVCHVAADLFPRFISAGELVTLMENRHEPEPSSWSFGWISQHIVKDVEPSSEAAVELRNEMSELIWRRSEQPQEPHDIQSEFRYLAPALAALCDRQLSEVAGEPELDLIRACVIGSRFGASEFDANKALSRLREQFEKNGSWRSAAFWQELAFMDAIAPDQDDWERFYHAAHHGIAGQPKELDREWLEAAFQDESRPERRAVVLHALIDLWHARGRNRSELGEFRKSAKGNDGLLEVLAERTAPRKQDKADKKVAAWEREDRRRKRALAQRKERHQEIWEKWGKELRDDPDSAFAEQRLPATVYNTYLWLRERSQDRQRFNIWDKNALTEAFGPDVVERAEAAFRTHWRAKPPALWSTRPADERNKYQHDWIAGLIGVSAESLNSGWSKGLSSDEARRAAAYATIEMNGFAPFVADLAESHPAEVEEVIGGELSAELKLGSDEQHLPVLQDVSHADNLVKRLLVPRLLSELIRWPDALTKESGGRWLHHLERVLRVLREAEGEEDRETIARECRKRYEADPTGPLALMWLRGLFQFHAEQGARVLMKAVGNGSGARSPEHAVVTFAAIFGGHDPVALEISDPTVCATVLRDLVRCAYACVRREDDAVHKGSYSPDTRDDAQTARNFLLSRLLDTPGSEARRVMLELAEESDFAHLRDRLKLLARNKAAAEAEFEPFDPAAVLALRKNLEAPPQGRDGLFTVMMDRLTDLDHEFRHGDFSDRRLVQKATQESEVQCTLAGRLQARANGAYKIAREEEVADRKRTDIRFLSVQGETKAVIEVKVADNWTATQLETALRDQLVGQYLRHADCKAGCLLLTYRGEKRFWRHPDSRKRLDFGEIVAFLRDKAAKIETKSSSDVRLAVFGLDLTDSASVSE